MTDSDKPAFAQAMNRLCIALREKEPDAVQMRTYFKALEELEIEFITAGADRLISSAAWFPKVPEWREAARTIESERIFEQRERIRKRRIAGLQPLCSDCEDTGFRKVSETRVGHCECRQLRRLEVLGRRPMPELPEAPPVVNNELRLLEAIKPAVKGMA